jgi:hypothetical protein
VKIGQTGMEYRSDRLQVSSVKFSYLFDSCS